MPKFSDRLSHAWNAFLNRDPTLPEENSEYYRPNEVSYSYNPYRHYLTRGNEKSIVAALYNRIAIDVSQLTVRHVKVNQNGYYEKTMDSDFNQCLTLAANKDQTARDFMIDLVTSMFDEGVVAVVPIDTNVNPDESSFDIESMRTAKIIDWRPNAVKVRCYNDNTGQYEERWALKRNTAIIENPFYQVMNQPNSTAQRLIRKLNLLDVIDEQSGSGKLDIIVQLPYQIKTPAKKKQAEERRKDIEMQLAGSKFGIAYADATEKITQLNRPIENNIMDQVNYLTETLYSQLGMTQSIMDGTADEQTLTNYYSQTIEPIIGSIVLAYKWKFLSKTARSQRQSIIYYRDPFKLVPTTKLPDLADKFTRNEIMSPNEFRQVVGLLPVDDERANQLSNRNLNHSPDESFANVGNQGTGINIDDLGGNQNG